MLLMKTKNTNQFGPKRSTIFRQRNGLGAPRLMRFETELESWLLSEKNQRNQKRLKLGKNPLPLIAIVEEILREKMLKQNGRRN